MDIRYTVEAGAMAAAMIFLALAVRGIGVVICMLGTRLNRKERVFCIIAYLLSLGLPCGKIVLSVAVLAIIITAPLGALGMDATYKRLLKKTET